MPDISESVAMLEKHLAIPTSPYFLLLVNGDVLRRPLTFLMLVGGTGGRGGIEIVSGSAP